LFVSLVVGVVGVVGVVVDSAATVEKWEMKICGQATSWPYLKTRRNKPIQRNLNDHLLSHAMVLLRSGS
jgi:hypothetical protein